MGFSATFNALSGTAQKPDSKMFVHFDGGRKIIVWTTNSKFNKAGYVPGLGSISGTARALLGIIHVIVHLSCAIFSSNRAHHMQEAKLGAKNVARGLVELIPIITMITDAYQMRKFEQMATANFNENFHAYSDDMVVYVNGVGVNRRAIAEVNAELEKLKRPVSTADFDAIIPISQNNN